MRVYIAGKVTGLPWAEVTAKFGQAQVELERRGFTVINPLAVVSHHHGITPKAHRLLDTPWEWCMRWCLRALMDSDAVVLLPCWTHSRGATLERYVAASLNIPIYEGIDDADLKRLEGSFVLKNPG